jgi:hypothetical protein
MSLSKYSRWEPPKLNLRGREISFINGIYTAHDTFCGCDDPPVHVLALLFYPMGPFDNNNLSKAIEKLKSKPQPPKCLTFGEAVGGDLDTASGDAATAGIDLLDTINTEELEKLFGEEEEEKDTEEKR